ncbi:hypothetical protein BDP27DRAFT_1338051 [Rhodocollybia butyracea]|uniref:Uncharacterized protein n=1 Tax=Rhodocollybia butyracea TaxID=206335 RepID=A0A9P5U0K3_9AGAR|nr:hypothetical protein BDP27DRAFT_1338051 [Rhodocollybia butyracea]
MLADSGASSSSGSTSSEELRTQAAPLPLKRGEIGYREDLVKEETEQRGNSPSPLPDRHPADRDAPASSSPNVSDSTAPLPAPAPTPATVSDDNSSTCSLKKRKAFVSFLKHKKCGIQLGTWFIFIIQLLVISGTIAAWVVAGISLSHPSNSSSSTSGSSAIFVHVVFTVGFLSQCLFFERRIYVMRAQRYAFLHHGEILPSSRRGRSVDASIAFSPWNRPPLPTYAAALAQSGVGTGDVEDHLIAAPPPPAYGYTRGSALLLSGFLDARLRAERPVSAATVMSQRPLSYASLDPEWEVIQDADRARRLEETLANLERPRSRQTRS